VAESISTNTVRSKDGTAIAFSQSGKGPALVLVDGALCHRKFGPMAGIARLLTPYFTVLTFDRRGRGESTNTEPYSVHREVEDIAAVIEAAGGTANLFGTSSGAALALEAAARLEGVKKVVLYEAPFFFDDAHPPRPDDYLGKMTALIAADRRAEALKLFMRTVGMPAIFINLMRFTPAWGKLKRVAHTLPYDLTIVSDTEAGAPLSVERWASVTMPVLTAVGGKSPAWWQKAMKELADVLPNAQHVTLPGQTHMVKASVLSPILTEFFTKSAGVGANGLRASDLSQGHVRARDGSAAG
jgi:pimeloyl-ACP methyl ester carboxylesterase